MFPGAGVLIILLLKVHNRPHLGGVRGIRYIPAALPENGSYIPGKDGFPDLDPKAHGLAEVSASEKGGLVYVNQKGPIDPEMLENTPDFFSPEQKFFKQVGFSDDANWKLIAETSMEGYPIRSLHKKSFFPMGLTI